MGAMSDNYFLEQTPSPEPAALRAALGEAYAWYEGVLGEASGFRQDWKHYGKKYGWKLKAHDGEKALFELTVLPLKFRIGMAVRELELRALRESLNGGEARADSEAKAGTELGDLAELLSEERSKEGWGIRLTIDSEASYRRARALIKAVAELRGKA